MTFTFVNLSIVLIFNSLYLLWSYLRCLLCCRIDPNSSSPSDLKCFWCIVISLSQPIPVHHYWRIQADNRLNFHTFAMVCKCKKKKIHLKYINKEVWIYLREYILNNAATSSQNLLRNRKTPIQNKTEEETIEMEAQALVELLHFVCTAESSFFRKAKSITVIILFFIMCNISCV